MTPRGFVLALICCAGPAMGASDDPPAERAAAPRLPVPIAAPAPMPSTGLSETILDRMRKRLVGHASKPRPGTEE